jgi:hypothetical protein
MDEPEQDKRVPVAGSGTGDSSRALIRQQKRDGTYLGLHALFWPPALARVIAAYDTGSGNGSFGVPPKWPAPWRAWLLRSVRRRLPGRSVELARPGGWSIQVTPRPPAA